MCAKPVLLAAGQLAQCEKPSQQRERSHAPSPDHKSTFPQTVQNKQATANNQQPKAYEATKLQVHKPTKCNYIQAHTPTAYNSQQPTTNIQPTFKSQQPPSNLYAQEPCKASCVLMAAGQLAQCAFGVNSHLRSVKDHMHNNNLAPQFTSPPFHKQLKTKKQQPPTSNLTHTKPQGYKSTSLQGAITYKPTNQQPTTASSQQPTYNVHSRASSHQAICTRKSHVKQPVCSWLLAR